MLFLLSILCAGSYAQSAGVEYYHYTGTRENPAEMVPLAHYTTKTNWYVEARYNYDDRQTFSFYGGRSFSGGNAFSYCITPMLGAMAGNTNGASVGANVELEKGRLFLSSQSQYSVSVEEKNNRYLFTWSELGYKLLPWCYSGLTVQQTNIFKLRGKIEPGCMVGLSFDNYTIPVYLFNIIRGQRYFILGFNWEWEKPAERIPTIKL